MNPKQTIRKLFFVGIWLLIGGGMLTLLVAAIGKKNRESCSDYRISIKGNKNNLFLDEKDLQQLLLLATNGKITGLPMKSFNLRQLEITLERNTWIKDAELFFDNRDVLHVVIAEREPIARIFTTAGNAYYIDNGGTRLPLTEKRSARVPVFTGFPERKLLTRKDSVLLEQVRTTALFIMNDAFWMSQVAQIDITPEKNLEMIPVVGNHLVRLGSGENIDKKMRRLFIFYKEVLSKTGFDKYKIIDVQYAGQVVASKQAGTNKVDMTQLRQNVEKLLRESRALQNDSLSAKTTIEKPSIHDDVTNAPMTKDSLGEAPGASAPDPKLTAGKRSLPSEAVKKSSGPVPLKSVFKTKTNENKVLEKKLPRAVMPKKNG